MSIIYFQLTIHDQKKIIKAQKGKTIGDCEISTKGRICYNKRICKNKTKNQSNPEYV